MPNNTRNLYKFLLICIAIPVFLTGCNATSFDALMQELEFECGETGEVSISTTLDLNSSPIASSNTSVIYTKKKEDPDAGCEAPVDE